MKRALTVAAVVGFLAVCVADASAISAGPGGRLYDAGRCVVGGVNSIRLGSLAVDSNWDVDWTNKWVVQGTVTDNTPSTENYKRSQGCSPEILSTTGGSSYATIVLGAASNRNPLAKTASSTVMDIVKLTTSASGMSVSLIGDGKAYTNSSTGYTEGGLFAQPDPKGQFTGSASNYFTGAYASSGYCYAIVSDTVPDGDPTNTASDYLYRNSTNNISIPDIEILGNRAYVMSGISNGTKAQYYDTSMVIHTFYDQTVAAGIRNYGGGFAAGICNGHATIWVATYDSISGANQLLVLQDLNDDGDANDVLENRLAGYRNTTVAGTWNDVSTGDTGWTDLELITGNDGKKFLLIQDTYNMADRGRAYLAMELADNGDYVGGSSGIKLILWEKGNGDGSQGSRGVSDLTGWTMMADAGSEVYNETEFDANAVPEPATLLLLGTGALGVMGYIRRRRIM